MGLGEVDFPQPEGNNMEIVEQNSKENDLSETLKHFLTPQEQPAADLYQRLIQIGFEVDSNENRMIEFKQNIEKLKAESIELRSKLLEIFAKEETDSIRKYGFNFTKVQKKKKEVDAKAALQYLKDHAKDMERYTVLNEERFMMDFPSNDAVKTVLGAPYIMVKPVEKK